MGNKLEKRKVYVCNFCNNYIEGEYNQGGPVPVCCGHEMEKLEAKTADYATEKHVPYVERKNGGVLVKVGKEVPHPMTAEHYIVFIEICADGMLMRKYLKPGDAPEAFFETNAKNIIAWELCNVHRYWKCNQ